MHIVTIPEFTLDLSQRSIQLPSLELPSLELPAELATEVFTTLENPEFINTLRQARWICCAIQLDFLERLTSSHALKLSKDFQQAMKVSLCNANTMTRYVENTTGVVLSFVMEQAIRVDWTNHMHDHLASVLRVDPSESIADNDPNVKQQEEQPCLVTLGTLMQKQNML